LIFAQLWTLGEFWKRLASIIAVKGGHVEHFLISFRWTVDALHSLSTCVWGTGYRDFKLNVPLCFAPPCSCYFQLQQFVHGFPGIYKFGYYWYRPVAVGSPCSRGFLMRGGLNIGVASTRPEAVLGKAPGSGRPLPVVAVAG